MSDPKIKVCACGKTQNERMGPAVRGGIGGWHVICRTCHCVGPRGRRGKTGEEWRHDAIDRWNAQLTVPSKPETIATR